MTTCYLCFGSTFNLSPLSYTMEYRLKGWRLRFTNLPFLGIQHLKYAGTSALLPAYLLVSVNIMYVIAPLVPVPVSVPVLRVGGQQCIPSTGWGRLLDYWVRIFVFVLNPFEGEVQGRGRGCQCWVKTLLHSGMGIGARIMGKKVLGVKHPQRHWRLSLSLCPGSTSPPLHFISAPPGSVREGGDKRQRSSIFLIGVVDGVEDHWLTLVHIRV